MKILAVTNIYPENGGYRGTFVELLVESLRKLGHTVDVEIVAQSHGKLDYLTAIPRVRRRARSGGYDIVHIHYGLAALAARFIGRRVPRVISLYGTDVNSPKQRFITKASWGGTKARIYVSQRMTVTAGDPTGHVLPNGVDFERFQPPSEVERQRIRAEYGFGPDDKVVLFGADPARPQKGYDVYSAVLTELRDRGLPVRELVLSAKNQPMSAVVAKTAAADLLLFTSRRNSEGSPTVVKEATAMGLPVVTVDVGDVAEVLDGVTPSAVVPFPTADPSTVDNGALVAALADAAAEVLAKGVRADGRERASRLDARLVAERVVNVYRQVLGQQPVAAP